AYSFHPNINFVNQALIDDARKRGLKTWVYTVNETDDWQHMCELGVDGVFTDVPQQLLQMNSKTER
ncbi:MAG: glycerophosphodiester phosphodiesterase, partial [Pseudomonadota bacterium]